MSMGRMHRAAPIDDRHPDRIEAAIERVLRDGGTRSELRDAIHPFAGHARMQQIPPEQALSRVKALAMRASPNMVDRVL